MPQMFTLDEARAAIATLKPRLDRFVRLRADLVELQAALTDGRSSNLGGLPEAKAFQA